MKQKRNRPLLVAITGNIGSGKTLTTSILEEKGYPVINADHITRKLLKSPNVVQELITTWGAKILTNNTFDRTKLRCLVFNNQRYRNQLNKYLHPLILHEMQNDLQMYQELSSSVIFFEIPLLFECGLEKCFDYNILVCAKEEIRFQRIIQRENYTPLLAKSMMKSQIPEKIKISHADLVLQNNSDLENLVIQIDVLIQLFPYLKRHKKLKKLTCCKNNNN